MTQWIYIPVPEELVLDVYELIGTTQQQAKPTAEQLFAQQLIAESQAAAHASDPPVTPVTGNKPVRRQRKPRAVKVSPRVMAQAKVRVKQLQEFTAKTLATALDVNQTYARLAIENLVAEGWAEPSKVERVGKAPTPSQFYRYLPAGTDPKTHPRHDDTTGRSISRPVAGTGRTVNGTGEVKEFVTALRKQGWSVVKTGGNHWKARKGNAVQVFASTPSDTRAIDNIRAQLRRVGVDV